MGESEGGGENELVIERFLRKGIKDQQIIL